MTQAEIQIDFRQVDFKWEKTLKGAGTQYLSKDVVCLFLRVQSWSKEQWPIFKGFGGHIRELFILN